MWLAGGGVKPGVTVGATDEISYNPVVDPVSVHDLHAINVGAYIESAQETEARTGFSHEMSIALQKASRTKYWLNVLHDGRFLDDEDYQTAYEECAEIRRLLGKIVKTTRGS